MITLDQVVTAIYRVENSTTHPYGIMTHYVHTSPKQACMNTVLHAARDYHMVNVDKKFIYYLANRYCPPSTDKQGNLNWKANMVQILHL